MEKNVRLVNIYIKIHNKQALTMDDMTFLAKWDPECFAKTCRNLVYNLPETDKLMQPAEEPNTDQVQPGQSVLPPEQSVLPPEPVEPVMTERERVQNFFANLKKLELNDLKVQDVNVENVKNLMGNLYMEMMFPHNDRESYFNVQTDPKDSVFNRRV
ncbi:MAG: hypothetical protein J1E64_03370 [Acetatifactor sp.]|nr:hypothetical protein [Acetatifactor sp.]